MTGGAKIVLTYGSWHGLVVTIYSIVFRATSDVTALADRQPDKVLLIGVACKGT